tara:strand:- start:2227 stop:4149 length:1923 start_codon:yes stop_codon:yes gene_type:complete
MSIANLDNIKNIETIQSLLEKLLKIPVDQRDTEVADIISYLLTLLQAPSNIEQIDTEKTVEYNINNVLSTSTDLQNYIEGKVVADTILPYRELAEDKRKQEQESDLNPQSPSVQREEADTPLETFTFKAIPSANQAIINNPTPEEYDYFAGSSIAIDGNQAIFGAIGDNTGATATGSAYIYDITTGNLLYTINNPTPETNDFFGASIAVTGNHAIIGDRGDNTGASSAGSAYIYDTSTGNLLHTINNPTPETFDHFGRSVSAAGGHAIIGARGDNTGATSAGSAYIYDTSTGNLLHTINNPTPENYDNFGISVAAGGSYTIIGASGDNTGATSTGSAYIYDTSTGNLLHTINNPTTTAYDSFGSTVSINDNYAVISAEGNNTAVEGAGAIYVYDTSTGNLLHTINNPDAEEYDYFGSSISFFGNYIVIGAPDDDLHEEDSGKAYIYDISTGNLLHTINNPEPGEEYYFGSSISVAENDLIISSDHGESALETVGSAYIYKGDFDGDGVVNGSSVDDILYGLDGDDVLAGLLGDDTLYGGDGADTFSLRDQGANDIDRIEDFTVGDNDKLDISDLLTGFNGEIEDYVRIIDDTINVGNSYLMINNDGDADATLDFVAVAYIVNGAGLDASTLYDNGQIIAI